MTTVILESEILRLRQFTPADSAFILRLVNTEEWKKYIGDRNMHTVQQATDYIMNGPVKSYAENGFGLWLAELKSSGEPIGMCGFVKRDYLPNPDIGFALLPEYAGRGYAFEMAAHTLQYGFTQMQLEKISAITIPANDRSVRLLEKIGFTYEETFLNRVTNEMLLKYGYEKNAANVNG